MDKHKFSRDKKVFLSVVLGFVFNMEVFTNSLKTIFCLLSFVLIVGNSRGSHAIGTPERDELIVENPSNTHAVGTPKRDLSGIRETIAKISEHTNSNFFSTAKEKSKGLQEMEEGYRPDDFKYDTRRYNNPGVIVPGIYSGPNIPRNQSINFGPSRTPQHVPSNQPVPPNRPVPSPNRPVPSPNQPVPSPNQPVPSPNQPVPSPNQPVPSPNQPVPTQVNDTESNGDEEEEGRVVHDYSHLHTEPKILTAPTDLMPSPQPGRKDLCAVCLCSADSSRIVCEHRHALFEDSKHQVTINKNMIPKEAQYIQVRGYDVVQVQGGAFEDGMTKLKLIVFEEIKEILLEKHSFYFRADARKNTELVIQFIGCGIPKFPSEGLTQLEEGRHGRQGSVKLEKTRFLSVEIIRCNIGSVEENGMSRARLIYFNLTDSEIKNMSRRAIDLDIYELCKIKGNKLPSLLPGTMCFHAKKTVFSRNDIQEIHNRSIVIETDGQVLLEFNHVKTLHGDALAGITPMGDVIGASIVFLMNTVEKAEPRALYIDQAFPAHERKVLNNSFQIECDCNISAKFEVLLGVSKTMHYDKASYENAIENSQCMEPATTSFVYIDDFLTKECVPFPIVTVSAVSAAIILFIIAVTVCVVCSLRVQHFKEEANVLGECTSQSFSTLSRNYNDYIEPGSPLKFGEGGQMPLWGMHPWVAAVPEIKTYQQSDAPVFTEQTESICGSNRGSLRDPRFDIERRFLDRASCPFN